MATQLKRKQDVETTTIPDRLYFKIGDVARICAVETYVLRFWETQFPQLKPNKSGTGQRLYRRHEVELALEIKRLVHDEGYTLAGARQALESTGRRRAPESVHPLRPSSPAARQEAVAATVGHARAELREIADQLATSVAKPARKKARVTTMPLSSGSLFPL
ncbi:MerR family transcriptional regulator [Telmatobacter bradus]|uniref:MerR family transcriptional regulator n=1 Tax=Telmatobacter bradus TaxID=474953 RepID=UPI003B43C764